MAGHGGRTASLESGQNCISMRMTTARGWSGLNSTVTNGKWPNTCSADCCGYLICRGRGLRQRYTVSTGSGRRWLPKWPVRAPRPDSDNDIDSE